MSKELNKAPVEQAGGDERDFQAEGAQEVPSPVSQEYDRHLISLLRKGEALPGHQEEAADEIERLRDWNDHLNNTVLPNILNPNFLMLMKGGERLLDLCTKDGKFIGVSLNDMKDVFDWMVTHARIAPDHAALAQPSPAQAEQHWPKLEKPVQVGAIRFHAGLSSRLVVEAAQRLYEFESTPEKEAERIERLQAFREQCFEPLGTEFSKVLSDNLPDLLSTAQAERPEFDESEREDMARIAFETAMANGISLDSFTFLSNSLAERYERIVGELRADRDSWAEQVEQRLADWDEMRKERDAALAKIAELDQALAEKDPFGAKLNRISEKLERCDALLAARAAQAGQVPQAWLDVQAERRRQITAEGWTPEHDDLYCAAELPRAAAAYILNGANDEAPAIWSFSAKWWKPRDARSNYVRAGALILAEIERLDRAAPGKEVGHE